MGVQTRQEVESGGGFEPLNQVKISENIWSNRNPCIQIYPQGKKTDPRSIPLGVLRCIAGVLLDET